MLKLLFDLPNQAALLIINQIPFTAVLLIWIEFMRYVSIILFSKG